MVRESGINHADVTNDSSAVVVDQQIGEMSTNKGPRAVPRDERNDEGSESTQQPNLEDKTQFRSCELTSHTIEGVGKTLSSSL